MPAIIKVIHANDFIKATSEGKLDVDASKKLLIEIALAADPLVNYDILVDTRKAQSKMTTTDLFQLVKELSSNFRHSLVHIQKTAILCPRDRFDHAEFFALCAQNRGFIVKAFTSVADAYEWLIMDSPSIDINPANDVTFEGQNDCHQGN